MTEELDRDRPLFNDAVAVQVKFPDHDKVLLLTVRVLQGSRVNPVGGVGGQREGVLHIELTDELDPFFLYTLQVGEDDYHQLKHDQCLRVDFQSFPRKFIELLESCRSDTESSGNSTEGARRGENTRKEGPTSTPVRSGEWAVGGQSDPRMAEPSFLARLETTVPGGFSVFSLVETNPFKELTHLSLRFRVGNDSAIKTYLAARLRQLKAEALLKSTSLSECEASLQRDAAARAQIESEVAALRMDRERDLRDLRTMHSAELTSAREEGIRRAEDAAAARAAEVDALRRKADADIREITQRLRQSEQRKEELTDLKFAHEAELRELRSRSEAAETGREAATNDAKTLREQNRALEARVFEAEREVERLRMQGTALTQQLADAKEMVEKSQALQAASGASVARLEDTQEAYKGSVVALQERLEASVSEINRGNAIIQKLQGQYRALRAKAKLKSEVIKQQERLLAEQEASAGAAESKLKAAAAEKRAAEARTEGLQRELVACEGRLEEGARLLKSNEQVIKWLNKELNDAQMLPGATPSTTTGTMLGNAGTGVVFGGVSTIAEALGDSNVESDAERVCAPARVPATPGTGRKTMFTAGIRESLNAEGVQGLRSTLLDHHDDRDGRLFPGDQTPGAAVGKPAEATPDHVGRGNDYRSSRGAFSRIVTPESAGIPESAQASRRFAAGDDEDVFVGRMGTDSVRGIPAF